MKGSRPTTITMDKTRIQGFIEASVSSASFGLIPLFSIPVLSAGMSLSSLLVYRFAFGCAVMLGVLIFNRTSLHLHRGEFLRICWLALLYDISALTLIWGYSYLPSGVATALLFSYPVWTNLIEIVFFHQHFSKSTATAIVLAVGGVFLLSGSEEGLSIVSVKGVLIELCSGLTYSIYMVSVGQMKIRKMGSLKLTFFVFLLGMLLLFFYCIFTQGRLQPITSGTMLINLLLIGLLPTALSNVSLIMAVKKIGSVLSAVLGAFEPLTAMCIGILVFGEPLTVAVAIGFLLILASVMILVLREKSNVSVAPRK